MSYCDICWQPDCKEHSLESVSNDLGPFERETSSIGSYRNIAPNLQSVEKLLARRIRLIHHYYASDNQYDAYTDEAVRMIVDSDKITLAVVHGHPITMTICNDKCATYYRE